MIKSRKLFGVAFAVVLGAVPAMSLAADNAASKETAIAVTDAAYAKATVVNIKKKEREVTLRDESGAEMVVVLGPEVRNFNQIKKGDIVEVEYHRAAATVLEKASEATVAGESTGIERNPVGAKPGARMTHTSSIIATVLDIDQKNRRITLQGPRGGVVTVDVPASMKNFDSLKKGDKVSAVYSEAVAISVKTPAKSK